MPLLEPKQPSAARTLKLLRYFILRSCAACCTATAGGYVDVLRRVVRCAVVCVFVCVCVCCACVCMSVCECVRVPVRVSACALFPSGVRERRLSHLTSPTTKPSRLSEPLNIQAQSTSSGFLPRLVGNLIRSHLTQADWRFSPNASTQGWNLRDCVYLEGGDPAHT